MNLRAKCVFSICLLGLLCVMLPGSLDRIEELLPWKLPYNLGMPLPAVARQYADNLFAKKSDEIGAEYQRALEDIAFDSRRIDDSGLHIRRCISFSVHYIDLLVKSRMATLLAAYDLAGILFDDAAFHEVKSDVVDYCHNRQHDAIGLLGRQIRIPNEGHDEIVQGIVDRVDKLMAMLVRDLAIKRDEIKVAGLKVQRAYAAAVGKRWDVFISHASEDKAFVGPLAEGLIKSGLSVWYDTTTLTVGDRLRRKIDEGLSKSRFGVVVLSRAFFAKEWPQIELDGLVAREIEGAKVILPVWHNISRAEVVRYSPILGGVLAADSTDGIDLIVKKLHDGMGSSQS
jgi:hypothetical protein